MEMCLDNSGEKKTTLKETEYRILRQFETFCTYESLRRKAKTVSTSQYVEKLLVLEEDQTRRIKDCAANLSLCRITIQNNLEHKQRKMQEKKERKERNKELKKPTMK